MLQAIFIAQIREREEQLALRTIDASLFLTYLHFIETGFNKVDINVNKSNAYRVFHQPKMSIIPGRVASSMGAST